MATQEKLQKSLDVLRKPSKQSGDLKKKDKIQHCYLVTEAITNPTVRVSPNFQLIFADTIEIFLQLCDDPEADVRMTSEECLNRIIRALSDGYVNKILFELHKEIKKNSTARSLRAALWLFSLLAHNIRPIKGKPYVSNLFPNLMKITLRNEEAVHETLALSLPKILKVLNSFSTENEMKALLKSFLKNINHESAAIRRTTVTSIFNICTNCRKSAIFSYCFNHLMDLLVPINNEQSDILILGVLSCLKTLLPNLYTSDNNTEKLIQLLELCIYYLTHKDHNVVNVCLETLNALLQNPEIKDVLLNKEGFVSTRINLKAASSVINPHSPSELSIETNETLFSESELTETLHTDIQWWINDSELKPQETMLNFQLEKSNFVSKLRSQSIGDNMDNLTLSENSSDKSYSVSTEDVLNFDDIQEVDIGDITDRNVPVVYLIRFISKFFLLKDNQGGLISDKTVRVSTKFLALSCLSSLIEIYPAGIFLYLDKNYSKSSKSNFSSQNVCYVFQYRNHQDPQLRGAVKNLMANFLKSYILNETHNLKSVCNNSQFKESISGCIIQFFIEGLEDESANCIRQTLSSLEPVFNYILLTDLNMLPLLDFLPYLSHNPYWLVKVALCELVSKIDYCTVFYVTGNNRFQDKILWNVLFELLNDSDQRVRTVAATSVATIVENLFMEDYGVNNDVMTVKAMSDIADLIKVLKNDLSNETDIDKKKFVEEMPFPFNQFFSKPTPHLEFTISKIIYKLSTIATTSTSKYLIRGCVETFLNLSQKFPCTVYENSWGITENCNTNSIPDLVKLNISFLLDTDQIYDIQSHINLLNLTSNLYAGFALYQIKPRENNEKWSMFSDKNFVVASEQLLEHNMKMLNVFHHVLNDLIPVTAQFKTVLPTLPTGNNLSPLKRRKSDLDKKSPTIAKDEKNESLGNFVYSSRYMKIYDLLQGAFVNYKISLEQESSQKFLDLLKSVLNSTSILLEVGTLIEFERCAEEILNFLRSTFVVDAENTVKTVRQLLKCLFATNLTANVMEFSKSSANDYEETNGGFYKNIFQKPYQYVVNSIETLRDIITDNYLHKTNIKRRSTLSKSSEKILENYIRIFESVVIKSLKQYTMTSDVKLQCQVLQLLSQLVQLRVNYCMLDSEQVFINFVLKQFEFIEEGQIPMSGDLIPKIFQFLVSLSYGKHHSKIVITTPKIIQLCDGLMASGQPDDTHCVPALEPIVFDVFLTRNKFNTTEIKELETTREVVMSMLLKLWKNQKITELITLVLDESKGSEKWFERSKRVFDVVLPELKKNKLTIDNCDKFNAVKKMILVLNPEVFQSHDEIILGFFQEPPQSQDDLTTTTSWLSKNIILLSIITLIQEDLLITKINKLKSEFSPGTIFENVTTKADPLHVNNDAETFNKIPAEFIFVKFLFRIISVVTSTLNCYRDDFLIVQLSSFILHCCYLLQSGGHCRVTKAAVNMFGKGTPFEERNVIKLNEINENFKKLSRFKPVLTFYWCYFLTVVNCNDKRFYGDLFEFDDTEIDNEKLKYHSINTEITRTGTVISLCDYAVENSSEMEYLTWFTSNFSHVLTNLSDEPPVFEFITSLHRDQTLSGIFIESLEENYEKMLATSNFVIKALKCIENCHVMQIGAVLRFLVPKMLKCRQISLVRQAANLAGCKVEILLTLTSEETKLQLPEENFQKIRQDLIALNLTQKYETLVSFLNKLGTVHYDLPPIELEQRRKIEPHAIKKVKINKKWFLSQIKLRNDDFNSGKETAQLLSKLEYNEILSFMSSTSFNKNCLKYCLKNKFKYSDIIKASISCLWKDIGSVVDKITNFDTETIFHNDEITDLINSIIPCIPSFLTFKITFENISNKNMEDLMKFSVLSLQYVQNFTHDLNINTIDAYLKASKEIFNQTMVMRLLDTHISLLCSSINSLYAIVETLLKNDKPLPATPNKFKPEPIRNTVHKLYILVTWFYELKTVNFTMIPSFLFESIRHITVSLSRLTSTYSYVLIPAKAYKNGWLPEVVNGNFNTEIPPLPIELMQDVQVLEEYIFRVNFLGWVNRKQFEETWMCLLSVLCYRNDEIDPIEFSDLMYSSSLAIKAITTLLIETLTVKEAGNPNMSKLIHVSRDSPINDDSLNVRKLKKVQTFLKDCYESYNEVHKVEICNVFDLKNFEKVNDAYSYGQVSIKYFLLTIESNESHYISKISENRLKMLETSGLDLNSCLQFLQDYYSQQLKPQANTHIRLLHETVKSVTIISDLFNDKSQFTWMLETFMELIKFHSLEDELLHQYLIVGICKSVAVLTPEIQVYEQTKKLLTQFLKSSYLSSRIACLYGFLYILEGCNLTDVTIGKLSEEMEVILPPIVEYIQLNLKTTNNILKKSQEHTILLWSVAFYLIEHVEESNLEQNFVTNTILTAIEVVNTKIITPLHQVIVKGLERLMLVKNFQVIKNYRKLALDKMKSENPVIALTGTQLLLSYMYKDCFINEESLNVPSNPEHLVQTIETISAIFERIKRGYVFEVEILCEVLPQVIEDFFSPSDILTKIIGEFLSPQQPHTKFLSKVVFEVFQSAIRKDQQSLLRDWVVFSLSNFTQSFSVGMATWCLTCFFISASSNPWLCAYFPYVQTRVGRYEYEDKKMLCIAGADFYNALISDVQREKFVETFRKVRDDTGAPFNDLLLSL